ncbi:amino-acid N-acetyltransferase [Treponema sp.]|uniref:amino-acid N-acetyltransferase n=1 Tax=Treponema sp. TaxID=166 RepID=UPI00257B286D|nr:amino-acid N-acetyltransferase [Treponema sp.]MBE6353362.1 amino-acid N-acetyltransferase [Treponema sp.]
MKAEIVHGKAEQIRDVIRYIQRFKDALVIIYMDENLIESPLFLSHIKDIAKIHDAGLKVIMIPGASKRIDEILKVSNISWSVHDNCRITGPEAMPLIKMAAFDVSNQVMTALAGEKKTALIGNWVRARGKGVVNGFDFGTNGEIDKLQVDTIQTVLDDGFIPIFPCIGWSAAGKPYNISSVELAKQVAIHLKADKLFYVVPDAEINDSTFSLPENIGLSGEGTVPAMNIEELDSFIETNKNTNGNVSREKIINLLKLAKEACISGVSRVHILNGSLDGTIPCEIFSDFGSGTMIYCNNYGTIRDMGRDDISAVLSVMKPFIDSGILLPRTKEMLNNQIGDYIVYELDGAIRACASLVKYPDGQMEIAGVAVDKTCSHIGIGPKLIEFLVSRATKLKAKSIFLLTTQTADWFETLGFTESTVESLPAKRREIWTPQRSSKVMRLNIKGNL